ncbi:MAG: (2Fe-2S) ferredoxin domain-containing protein, partial [Methylococcales bacterium]|nr:(2Fe-2S) ferredoxin domain-containing protein [Methylococcales bacterium]
HQRLSKASCHSRGSVAIAEALEKEIHRQNLSISVERITCFGHCEEGVNVRLVGGKFWHHVTPPDVSALLEQVISMTD